MMIVIEKERPANFLAPGRATAPVDFSSQKIKGSHNGQIVWFDHEVHRPSPIYIASSFQEFIEGLTPMPEAEDASPNLDNDQIVIRKWEP